MNTNGQREDLRFSVLPMDFCPRCPIPAHPDNARYGTPVALAGTLKQPIIRYICLSCRLVWDISWDVAGLANDFPSYRTFSDTFIRDAEGLEAHRQGGIDLPAGPRSAFTQSEGRQRAAL